MQRKQLSESKDNLPDRERERSYRMGEKSLPAIY
jgi:hypothetical protein